MTVEELLVYGKQYIHKDHAKILLAELIGKNPLELLNYLNYEVSKEYEELYKKEVQSLIEGQPLQYVMGYVNFYGNRFEIDKRVLIPRFETEELVENTINYINKYFKEPIDLIDLGCGSGVIGITIEKKVSTNSVDLIDISEDALEVAHKNCEKLNSKANLIKSDFFSNINKKYDVIISNPPYIMEDEEIEPIVRNNEPHQALYAGEQGLDCYKKILKDINNHCKEKCLIAFEIGANQKDLIIDLINTYIKKSTIIVKKDLSGKDRMIFILINLE